MPPKKFASTSMNKIISDAEIENIFNKYSEGNECMNDEQLFSFLTDALGMAGDDPIVGFITASVMDLKKIDEVRLQNMTALFHHVRVRDLEDLRQKVSTFKTFISLKEDYKKMYIKIFPLYTGAYTTLDLDTTRQLWQVYLKDKMKYFKQFQQYLDQLPDKETKKVHKDLWRMVLEFSFQINNFEKDYKEEDGWPIFLDEFVEFMKRGCK